LNNSKRGLINNFQRVIQGKILILDELVTLIEPKRDTPENGKLMAIFSRNIVSKDPNHKKT
jgi:hypothetical protein